MVLGIKVIFELKKYILYTFKDLLHNIIDIVIAKLIEEIVKLIQVFTTVAHLIQFTLVTLTLQ